MKRVIIFILLLCASAFSQQIDTPIYTIQGDGGRSPRVGTQVSTRGIVTAITDKGFFIQTPDENIDKSSKTSEGIFVYMNNEGMGKLAIGDIAQVSGTITEFQPRTDRFALPLTQITRPRIQIVSSGNPLPVPILLTAVDLDPSGSIEQMERYEGMRVKINSLTVSAPTGGRIDDKTGIAYTDGVFYGVLSGMPLPMREPGIEVVNAVVDKLPRNILVFDMNPENLRIDSAALINLNKDSGDKDKPKQKQIHVGIGDEVKNITGVIDYARKSYTLLVDADRSALTIKAKKPAAVPVVKPNEREVLVGSYNLENFFDDESNSEGIEREQVTPKDVFAGRMNKISLGIRNILQMPDVLGVIEAENIKALKKLADKINADAIAAQQPNPNYAAYLEEGNDGRGIDVGFLVKSSRVKVNEVKQLGKDAKFEAEGAKPDDKLFDRPPLMIRAEAADQKSGKPFGFTMIINHFKSYGGIDDEKDGPRIQQKKRLQAEWLANFVAERGKTNPDERLILCGDFNAFEFPDGYNDQIGILRGKSNINVKAPSTLNLQTNLINLVDFAPKSQRFSFSFNGNAQTLDHILVNEAAAMRALKFGYGRLGAEFPLLFYNDYTRPERISDHDAPMLYLSLDEIKPAEVKKAVGSDK